MIGGWANLADNLRTIALLNPRLALMMAKGQPMAPRSYQLNINWDDAGTVGSIVTTAFQERFYQPVWIQQFVYNIRAPQANNGSLFKPIIDAYRNETPWINVSLRIEGPDRFQLTEGYIALENIATTRGNDRDLLNNAWVIDQDQNLFVDAILDRNLAEDEIPYVLQMTMTGLELSGCNLRQVGYQEAVCALKEMGLYPQFQAK